MIAVAEFNLSTVISFIIIALYNIAFGLASGPVTWLYMPEILPDVGVGISSAFVWVNMGIIGYFFPIIKDKY